MCFSLRVLQEGWWELVVLTVIKGCEIFVLCGDLGEYCQIGITNLLAISIYNLFRSFLIFCMLIWQVFILNVWYNVVMCCNIG